MKNILLILATVCIINSYSHKALKLKTIIFASLSIIYLIIIFIISPTDTLYNMVYSKNKILIDEQAFHSADNDNYIKLAENDKAIICFYTTQCSVCKKSAEKIALIAKNNNIKHDDIQIIFAGHDSIGANNFYIETKIPEYKTYFIDTQSFNKITKGYAPVIVLYDGGQIVNNFSYQNINDKQISLFINN
jgi:thiol-disulfide isomerase/thioredoxin